ncbi:MAG: hypothetical protein HC880_13465 [Bacteroidia bacterium]|nr:hypothetical protein [Bacteroidia bacterium]
MKKNKPEYTFETPDFLAGGGEMGELMRSTDWAKTPLGSVENWPSSLRTVVRIMLTSRQPIWVGWGPQLINLYNDPYQSILGGKHPQAFGQPVSKVWKEIWKDIDPMLSHVMNKNEGTYVESQLLIMERNGYPEETYYTFSYSPVPGDEDGVGGIICANTEDTQRVIGERQLASLRELAAQTVDARTVTEACRASARALAANPYDIPFAALYLVEEDKRLLSLATTIGIDEHQAIVSNLLSFEETALCSVSELIQKRELWVSPELGNHFLDLPRGAWDAAPQQVAAVPIIQSGHAGILGVLVVGLNPYRLLMIITSGFWILFPDKLPPGLSTPSRMKKNVSAPKPWLSWIEPKPFFLAILATSSAPRSH